MHSAYAKAGLNTNLTTTEVLAQRTIGFFESAAGSQTFVEDNELPVTDEFTYPGSIITSDAKVKCSVGLQERTFVNHLNDGMTV